MSSLGTQAVRVAVLSTACTLAVSACGGDDTGNDAKPALSGEIAVEGSRQAFPFTQAAAEQFQTEHPGVTITVERSSVRGALEKLCRGSIEIAGAARAIRTARAIPACERSDLEPTAVEAGSGDALPLVMYASESGLERPEVAAFMRFIAENGEGIAAATPD